MNGQRLLDPQHVGELIPRALWHLTCPETDPPADWHWILACFAPEIRATLALCESASEAKFAAAFAGREGCRAQHGHLIAGLYTLTPQYAVKNYRVDFLLEGPGVRLVIEIDGAPFHETARQIRADKERQQHLQSYGFQVVRIPSRYAFWQPAEVWKLIHMTHPPRPARAKEDVA